MNWTEATKVEHVDDGHFRAHVDEDWTSLQGVHGGIVAALALSATEQVLQQAGVDPATTLRAATFGYVSGNSVGDLTIDVEVIRRGRTMITTHARTSQQGKTTTIARFHHSTPRGGPEFSDAPPPAVRPADTVHLHRGDKPAHLNNVETYLHPSTTLFAGTDRAEWIAWSRPLHGSTLDSAWLTMFGDYFPPA
ncbi:MAG TPA: acyl-CoA thioesterase domain-containing protein, partial [Mycobacteriales bacterium]